MKKHKYKIGIDTITLEHDIENLSKATEKFKKTVIDAKALSKVKKIMDKSIERTGEPYHGFDRFTKKFKAIKNQLPVLWIYYPYIREQKHKK